MKWFSTEQTLGVGIYFMQEKMLLFALEIELIRDIHGIVSGDGFEKAVDRYREALAALVKNL